MEKLLTIFDGPRLISCDFTTRQIGKVKKRKLVVNMSSQSKFTVNEKKRTAIISWSMQSNTAGVPFKFAIEVEALFKIAKPATKKEIIQAGKTEAGPVLLVFLRAIIADLTTKADLNPFYPNYPDFSKLESKIKKDRSVSKKKNNSAE